MKPAPRLMTVWHYRVNIPYEDNLILAFIVTLGNVSLICVDCMKYLNRSNIVEHAKRVKNGHGR